MEYEEIISRKYSVAVAKNTIRTLLMLPNVIKSDVYYYWNLIKDDPDDNKFVDCAIAANIDYIVSNVRHFNVLEDIDFPKVNVINLGQFQALLFNSPYAGGREQPCLSLRLSVTSCRGYFYSHYN